MKQLPNRMMFNSAGTPWADRLVFDPTVVAVQPGALSTLWDAVTALFVALAGGVTVPLGAGTLPWTTAELWGLFDQYALIEKARVDPETGVRTVSLVPNRCIPPFITGLDPIFVAEVKEILDRFEVQDKQTDPDDSDELDEVR